MKIGNRYFKFIILDAGSLLISSIVHIIFGSFIFPFAPAKTTFEYL